MNKKIALVTGASGFVGSHLADLLLEKGFEVRALVRKTSSLKWLEGKNIEIHDCGFFDPEGLREAVKGVDYVFHVAGVVRAKTPKEFYRGNVETTKNLLEAILEVNPNLERLLVVSSFAANGPAKDETGAKEDDEPHPISQYGKSKLEEEKLVKKYYDKLSITIVRPPAVYGERETDIYLFFKTFKSGLMTMVGFDKKLVSLVHAVDLVEGIFLAATNENSKSEIYYVGSEKFYTWDEIGDATAKAFGKDALRIKIPHFIVYIIGAIAQFFSLFSKRPATFNFEKAREFVQKYQICDTSKAVRELGYRQKISLESGIKRTVDWYKEMKWL
jgi:nucleoside-diphosphate-sugar epimerase